MGLNLIKVLKNNASSKDTDGKIPKDTQMSTKTDKDVQDSQRKDGQMNTPTRFPIRPLGVNAVKLMILISVAELQNLHVAGTEFLTQNST